MIVFGVSTAVLYIVRILRPAATAYRHRAAREREDGCTAGYRGSEELMDRPIAMLTMPVVGLSTCLGSVPVSRVRARVSCLFVEKVSRLSGLPSTSLLPMYCTYTSYLRYGSISSCSQQSEKVVAKAVRGRRLPEPHVSAQRAPLRSSASSPSCSKPPDTYLHRPSAACDKDSSVCHQSCNEDAHGR